MNRRRGQALVEFALVLPLLLLLLVGLVEFGRAWNLHQVVTDASREGARHAVLQSGVATSVRDDSVRAVVNRALANAAVNPNNPAIDVDVSPSTLAGDPVTVEVRVPYEFVFLGPMMSWFAQGWGGTDNAITLTSRSTMRNE